MSAYRDALTKLFIKGSFSKDDLPRPAWRDTTPARPKTAPVAGRAAAPRPVPPRAAPDQPPLVAPAPKPIAQTQRDDSHPGRLLASKLRAHGKTASDLARDMHVPVNRVTAIINGQRGITADTALRLGHWFTEPPENWLDAQQRYELARARSEFGAEIRRLPRLAPSRQSISRSA